MSPQVTMIGGDARPGARARDPAMPEVRLFELAGRPCRHEIQGRPHRHLSQIYRCAQRNGIPGFELSEEL